MGLAVTLFYLSWDGDLMVMGIVRAYLDVLLAEIKFQGSFSV
jgi:hypothetical protein